MRTLHAWLLALGPIAGAAPLLAGTSDPDPEPVHWSVPPLHEAVAPGHDVSLTLHAAIQPGWHLYALNEPEGGPLATEVGLAQGDLPDVSSVTESHPVERYDPVMAKRLRFHLQQADFQLQLAVPQAAPAGPQTLHVLARFQACSDRLCLPPRTRSVTAVLQVGPG